VHDRGVIGRAFAAVAIVFVVLAALLLGPIHATGVRGTALQPHYVPFYVGFYSYAPLAGSADAKAVLKQAGITAPSVAVRRRRETAAAAIACAVVVGGVVVIRARRDPKPA
jgi:hypothetical protein